MIKSIGTLRYDRPDGYGWRLVLEIDPGIAQFYRSLIPKWYTAHSQAAKPHITIVRVAKPPKIEAWGKYEGEKIEFYYDPYIHQGGFYWWLNCYSKRLEEIANELGLVFIDHPGFAKPMKGYKKVWHTTLANQKPIVMQDRKRKPKG